MTRVALNEIEDLRQREREKNEKETSWRQEGDGRAKKPEQNKPNVHKVTDDGKQKIQQLQKGTPKRAEKHKKGRSDTLGQKISSQMYFIHRNA